MDQNNIGSCINRCGFVKDARFLRLGCTCQDGCEGKSCCGDYAELCTNGSYSRPLKDSEISLAEVHDAIERWSWTRHDLFESFILCGISSEAEDRNILAQDQYWTEFIPHIQRGGKCFTYSLPTEVPAGYNYALKFELKIPIKSQDSWKIDNFLKNQLLIYLHQEESFYMTTQSKFPNIKIVDTSWLKLSTVNRIAIDMTTHTSINLDKRPCNEDPNYNFAKCVDAYFYKELGCQPPWHYYDDIQVPVCTNVTTIKSLYKNGEEGSIQMQNKRRYLMTHLDTVSTTGCLPSCKRTTYKTTFSHRSKQHKNFHGRLLNTKPVCSVRIWFKDYLFTYEEEYLVCNWTCLIGEIGGNLGFFLGGSMLGMSDTILKWMAKYQRKLT